MSAYFRVTEQRRAAAALPAVESAATGPEVESHPKYREADAVLRSHRLLLLLREKAIRVFLHTYIHTPLYLSRLLLMD